MTAVASDSLALLVAAPNGIAQLRAMILELSLRGNLLKQKPDLSPDLEGVPYRVPSTWTWSALGDVTSLLTDGEHLTPPRTTDRTQVALATAKNVRDGYIDLNDTDFVERDVAERCWIRCQPTQGDVLMVSVGATLGRLAVMRHDREMVIVRSVALFRPKGVDPDYLALALRSPLGQGQIWARVKQSAQPCLYLSQARQLLLPIPPLAEQHRIVAKVDELMALCDRLEARQKEAEAAHARLVQTLLDSLTQARDAEEFQACWQRIATTFEEAIISEASIDTLTRAVRKLAFQGALSRHGATDWSHVRVSDAVQFLNGYAFKSEWFVPHGIRLVRNVNIAHGYIDWRHAACVPAERFGEFSAFMLFEGDVLLTLDRPIISTGLKVAVVRKEDLPCLLLQRVARLTPKAEQVLPSFLLHWLRSPLFIDAIDPGRSNGVPHISTKQVGSMMIPLPALDEQDRIVARLDELLALCDQLKARIATARAKHAQLAEALAAQAVAA